MEVAVLIGLQASGKTTFYRQYLARTHAHVSKDNFPNARRRQSRQMRLIGEALASSRSVVVDNTNPSPQEWRPLIAAARDHGAVVTGYWFPPDAALSVARNAARPDRTRGPDAGLYATLAALRQPARADGFDLVYVVHQDGRGGFTVAELGTEHGR